MNKKLDKMFNYLVMDYINNLNRLNIDVLNTALFM